jgi:hypothetical protein
MVATRSVASWPGYQQGGRIGLKIFNETAAKATFDDFGGGTPACAIMPKLSLPALATGYAWSNSTIATSNSTRAAAPGLIDGNEAVDVYLRGVDEITTRWESAGMLFKNTQNVAQVKFIDGATDAAGADAFRLTRRLP